jgi:hypothetical protein
MQTKLKKNLLRTGTLPAKTDRDVRKGFTGISSGNVENVTWQTVAYEHSKEYLAHLAEVEIQRSIALSEARRLALR